MGAMAGSSASEAGGVHPQRVEHVDHSRQQDGIAKPLPLRQQRLSVGTNGSLYLRPLSQEAAGEAGILRAAVAQLAERLAARKLGPVTGIMHSTVEATVREKHSGQPEGSQPAGSIRCSNSGASLQGRGILKPKPRKPQQLLLCWPSQHRRHDSPAPEFPLHTILQPQPSLHIAAWIDQRKQARHAEVAEAHTCSSWGGRISAVHDTGHVSIDSQGRIQFPQPMSSPASEAPPPVNAGVDVNVSISPTSGAALYATDPAEKATHSIAPDDRASKGQEASPQLAATVTATVELQPAAKRRRLSMEGETKADDSKRILPLDDEEDMQHYAVATPDQSEGRIEAPEEMLPSPPSPTPGEGACLPDSMVSLPEIEASPPPSLPKPESGQPNEAALLGKEQTPFIPDWIAAYSPFSRQPPSTSNDKGEPAELQHAVDSMQLNDSNKEPSGADEEGSRTPKELLLTRMGSKADAALEQLPEGAQPCSEHREGGGLVALNCRPVRNPGGTRLDHPAFQRLLTMIRADSHAFEADGRILRLKQHMPSDANCAMIEAVIAALAVNTRVQALYIQNFERGMCNRQLELLTEVLKSGRIWALNIGENFLVTLDAWQQFTDALPSTAVSYLYVSEHHLLRTNLKVQMRDAIRGNRRQLPPPDPAVTSRITNMWWNPPRNRLPAKQSGKRRV